MDGTAPSLLMFAEPQAIASDLEWQSALEMLLRARRSVLGMTRAAELNNSDPAVAAQEAQGREEQRLWLAVLDRSEEARARLVEALYRIATGRYGLCSGCGAPIPAERLQTLAFAVRCLPCQVRFETGLGNSATPSTARQTSPPSPADPF